MSDAAHHGIEDIPMPEDESRAKSPAREPPSLPANTPGLANSPIISLAKLDAREQLKANDGWRRKIWLLMNEPSLSPIASLVHNVYGVIILTSVVSTVFSTMPEYKSDSALAALEVIFSVLFSLDVVLRTSTSPMPALLLRSMYFWMDIGAVTPFYLMVIFNLDPDNQPFFELLWLLVPILRLLKITRHSPGWRILLVSMKVCIVPLLVPAFLLVLMTVLCSCVLFFAEKKGAWEDGEEGAFESIPHAMWFTIVTISTVGYGDVSPNTVYGKVVAVIVIVTGICYMAMPIAIVGTMFTQVWYDKDKILIAQKAKEKFDEGGLSKEKCLELFAATDTDGSGKLCRAEFFGLIHAFNLGLTPVQVRNLYKAIDEDQSGAVTPFEFCEFLFPEVVLDDDDPAPTPILVKNPSNQQIILPSQVKRQSTDNTSSSPSLGLDKSPYLGKVMQRVSNNKRPDSNVVGEKQVIQLEERMTAVEQGIEALQNESRANFEELHRVLAAHDILGSGDMQSYEAGCTGGSSGDWNPLRTNDIPGVVQGGQG